MMGVRKGCLKTPWTTLSQFETKDFVFLEYTHIIEEKKT